MAATELTGIGSCHCPLQYYHSIVIFHLSEEYLSSFYGREEVAARNSDDDRHLAPLFVALVCSSARGVVCGR